MFKKYLLILLAATALSATTGCSLFKSDSEETDETVAEETTSEEPTTEGEEATVADSTDEEEVVDEYPDDDYGDDSSTTAATETPAEDTATTDSATETTTAAADSELPDQPVESTDESLFVAGDTPSDSTPSEALPTPVVQDSYDGGPKFISVRKIKKTPYDDGGVLINRVYIARDGDHLKNVAEKIYGDAGRSSDLLKWNSHFAGGKALKTGDKLYYASPRNPADNSQMLTYYEDIGVAPSMYTAQGGESIRKVSEQLLGSPRSWMEVWATNDVESKWALPAGTQLRYWPADASAAAPTQQVAEAPADDSLAPAEEAPAVAANEELPPPAEEGIAPSEDMPAPEDDSAAIAANNEDMPPPPDDVSAPPAPPITPPEPPAENGLAGMMNGQDDSMMIGVLGGLLILAALILLIFIKRGRKKVKYG